MSPFSSYEQTIEWLYDLHLFGIKFGLKKIEKLLEFLNNPQDKLRIIHVGGTNGKGSVCTMVSYILSAAGFKVGLNTSPHLSEFTERIQINGRQISKEEVVQYTNLLEEIREKVNIETKFGYATYFEVVSAMALKYFADNNVDYVVLEVGLGGKFDATNIVNPLVTVITNTDLDHTEHLGNTLASVAENKAGIIKPGSPVVTTNKNQEVMKVITQTCEAMGSKLYRVGKQFKFKVINSNTHGLTWNYNGIKSNYLNLHIPLLGLHQGENGAAAICALELLMETDPTHPNLSEANIRLGLSQVHWPGRLEIMQNAPTVLLDGAHNSGGARTLRKALELFDYQSMHLVFGCSEEKDIKSITQELMPKVNKVYITQADIRRAAKPDLILNQIKDYDCEKIVIESVKAAVNTAVSKAQKDDLVCVCGSLFVVGEARELWTGKNLAENGKKLPRIHY